MLLRMEKNYMRFAISPDHKAEDFEGELTLDQKIEIFISRVKGWQIKPAFDMKESKIKHRGFAQLLIVTSYFEMIGKYRDGYIGEGDSAKYFKEGLVYTFKELSEDEEDVLNAFYKGVRNGLYHVGMTSPNVIIYDDIPKSFGYNEESGAIAISPDRFIQDIAIRFEDFVKELTNKDNEDLRKNFEARFDDDNSW